MHAKVRASKTVAGLAKHGAAIHSMSCRVPFQSSLAAFCRHRAQPSAVHTLYGSEWGLGFVAAALEAKEEGRGGTRQQG